MQRLKNSTPTTWLLDTNFCFLNGGAPPQQKTKTCRVSFFLRAAVFWKKKFSRPPNQTNIVTPSLNTHGMFSPYLCYASRNVHEAKWCCVFFTGIIREPYNHCCYMQALQLWSRRHHHREGVWDSSQWFHWKHMHHRERIWEMQVAWDQKESENPRWEDAQRV